MCGWASAGRTSAAVTGWLVILTGIVSAATLSVATVGFFSDLADVNQELGIIVVVLAMGTVAAWGATETTWLVAAITVVEVGALGVVAVMAGDNLADLPERRGELLPDSTSAAWAGVFGGAFLAFYAFIGFEDMVNMAEEVKRPRRNLPIAILASVVITVLIYVPISAIGVFSVDPAELAESTDAHGRHRGDGKLVRRPRSRGCEHDGGRQRRPRTDCDGGAGVIRNGTTGTGALIIREGLRAHADAGDCHRGDDGRRHGISAIPPVDDTREGDEHDHLGRLWPGEPRPMADQAARPGSRRGGLPRTHVSSVGGCRGFAASCWSIGSGNSRRAAEKQWAREQSSSSRCVLILPLVIFRYKLLGRRVGHVARWRGRHPDRPH